jgi:hypothetical protein
MEHFHQKEALALPLEQEVNQGNPESFLITSRPKPMDNEM